MSGNGVSWSVFPATRMSDGKDFGIVIVMNRLVSRSMRVIPFEINTDPKWWMTTGDCHRKDNKCYYADGLVCDIQDTLKEWGLKSPEKDDVKSSSRSFPIWKFAHPTCTKDEVIEKDGKFVRILTLQWPDWKKFSSTDEIQMVTHILEGDPMMTAGLASNGWFRSKYAHIAKVCDIQRPEAKEVSVSRAQVMADLGF